MAGNKRLIVVANRLPITIVRSGKHSWTLQRNSAGGLVTALSGIKDQFEMRWVGWTGVVVPDKKGRHSLSKALEAEGCIPVFLDNDTVDGYYNGYSNNILWPLFHHFSLPQPRDLKTAQRTISQFTTYKKANEMFAKVVMKNYKEGDIVWIHDYHLMLLPKYLKTENNRIVIGWFLHSAFPSFQCYRALPSREEILEAVVAADLIGFHIDDYANNFVEACTHLIGLERVPQGLQDVNGKLTRVISSPIGIEPNKFFQQLATPKIPMLIEKIKQETKGRKKIILGIDRLDPIKGIPHKLLGFQQFLEQNPNWWDKVVFFQLLVPSRIDVPLYQQLEIQVNGIFGKISSDYSTIFTRHPILVKHNSLPFDELCALLSFADVAVITSLSDGMNLVSYEYVACQKDRKGVLILSENAGAAKFLSQGALVVNPWDVDDVASKIKQALEMPYQEKKRMHNVNFEYVTTYTTEDWAKKLIRELTIINEDRLISRMSTCAQRKRKPKKRRRMSICTPKKSSRMNLLGILEIMIVSLLVIIIVYHILIIVF